MLCTKFLAQQLVFLVKLSKIVPLFNFTIFPAFHYKTSKVTSTTNVSKFYLLLDVDKVSKTPK